MKHLIFLFWIAVVVGEGYTVHSVTNDTEQGFKQWTMEHPRAQITDVTVVPGNLWSYSKQRMKLYSVVFIEYKKRPSIAPFWDIVDQRGL